MGDREVLVRLRADISQFQRSLAAAAAETKAFERELNNGDKNLSSFEKSTKSTSNEVDKLSGRLGILRDAAIILGPAFVPIGALAVPAVAGLASQLGAAALGAGTAILAFQGVGNALKTVNAAALNPTSANLQKARVAMEQLSPAAQDFVRELQHLQPLLKTLEGTAASNFFPGLTEAIQSLTTKAPQFERIIGEVGATLGNLSAEAGKALSGSGFSNFFDYIEREAPKILSQMGHAIGDVVHGLSQLAVATDPLQQDFGSWMLKAAEGFDKWATGLSKTQGFHDFVNYVEQHGPEVADAVAAIGNALLQIVEAAGPLGGPTLRALTAVADVIAKVADSKAGPAILATAQALAILNRTQIAFGKAGESSFGQAARGLKGIEAQRAAWIKGGAAAAGFGLAVSGASDKSWLLNTASLALMGSIAGPWGAAIGGGVGLLEAFAGGQKTAVTDAETLTSTLDKQTGAVTQNTTAYVAQQFASDGVLANAQKLGINLSDVTQAALGNSDALARVNAQAAAVQATFVGNAPKMVSFGDTWSVVSNAIGDTNSQLTSGQKKLLLVAAATGSTASSFKAAKSAAQQFADQIAHLNNVLARRASLRDYQQAIDDFTKSIKKNGDTLDINTQKGRDNQAALDGIAAAAAQVAQKLHGADRSDFMSNARKAFVDAAQKAGLSAKAAQNLADKIHLVDQSHAEPRVGLDTGNFYRETNGVLAQLNSLNGKTVRAYVDVTTRHFGGDPGLADAHGGHHATGGLITGPGGPTGDRILARLSDREYVVRAAAVDHYGVGFFNSLNAMRLAGGGPTSGGSNQPNQFFIAGIDGSLKSFKDALDAAKKKVDDERTARQNLIQSEKDFAAAVGASVAKADPFSGDLTGFDTATQANTNDTNAANAALGTAASNGLSGSLYQALASSGNLLLEQQFAALSPAEIAQKMAEYASQNNAENALGSSAGSTAFAQAIKDSTKQLHQSAQIQKALTITVKQLEAEMKKIGNHVETGARKGVGDRNTQTRNHIRTGG